MFRRRPAAHPPPERDADRRATIEVVDDTNFEAVTAGRPTVVDLWAPWCPPCRSFRPIFEAVAATWDDTVRFGSCNLDESPDTGMRLQVRSIPTVVAFDGDGNEFGRLVGVPSKARFEALVSDLVAHAGPAGTTHLP